jgi:hypothetical protein
MKVDKNAPLAARRLQKRGKIQKANYSVGTKVPGIVQTESGGESALGAAAELDPRVRAWKPQPFCTDLQTGQVMPTKDAMIAAHSGSGYKPMIYTPDFQIDLKCGLVTIVESKHTTWIDENTARIEFLKERMPLLGYRFRIFTQRDIPPPLEQNLLLLRRYLFWPVSCRADEIVAFCTAPRELRHIEQYLGITQKDILIAVAHGLLSCNLRLQRIMPRTLMQADNGESSYLKLLDF